MALSPEPSGIRKAVVFGGALSAVVGLYVFARELGSTSTSVASGVASFFAALLAGLITGSFGEWLVHRYLMHRPLGKGILYLPYALHHRAHHWVQFPPDEYVQRDRVQRVPVGRDRESQVCATGLGRALVVSAHVSFYSVFACLLAFLPAFALARNPVFAWTLSLEIAVFLFLFVHVHDAVHHPGLSPLERFAWFRFLDRHHYVHHVDTQANTNFLLPLGDWLLGTLRLELTPAERAVWPSYEEARRKEVRPIFDEHGRKRRSARVASY